MAKDVGYPQSKPSPASGLKGKAAGWDGTSGSGTSPSPLDPPEQGQTNPPIRGTATSALQADENDYIVRPTGTAGDKSQWPKGSDSGSKESAQGR